MALHRLYHEQDLRLGTLLIDGDEAHHAARVKRLQEGDPVQILNGRGQIGLAAVSGLARAGSGWALTVEVQRLERAEPVRPRVDVLSAAPKGPRLTDMIDGLSQAGAASWSLLATDRGEVDPRPGKLEKVRRTAAEASKQCGRAWILEIGPETTLAALTRPDHGLLVIADASGAPFAGAEADAVTLLIGPEGGWTVRELEQARAAGARITTFGPHTMRIETAAVVATGIILAAGRRA